jgi:NarL family two-component system response regulator LiaR
MPDPHLAVGPSSISPRDGRTFEEGEPVPLRVIITDDDPMARRVVRDALHAAGIVVIAEASNGREAIELAVHYRPDVLLMDVVMPGMDGVQATREAARAVPETKVVVLTAYDDDDLGLLALRAGAAGFLSKAIDVDDLPASLTSALADEAVVSPRLTMRLVEHLRRVREDTTGLRPVVSPLTDREWEVLDLLCQGFSTEAVADALVLSTETVRSHIKNLLRKFGVSSRTEAIDIAKHIRTELVVSHGR